MSLGVLVLSLAMLSLDASAVASMRRTIVVLKSRFVCALRESLSDPSIGYVQLLFRLRLPRCLTGMRILLGHDSSFVSHDLPRR